MENTQTLNDRGDMQDTIARWTVGQIGAFLRLWSEPARTGFAQNKEEALFLSGLARRGFINVMGKVGDRVRFQCDYTKFSGSDIELMKQIHGIKPI